MDCCCFGILVPEPQETGDRRPLRQTMNVRTIFLRLNYRDSGTQGTVLASIIVVRIKTESYSQILTSQKSIFYNYF